MSSGKVIGYAMAVVLVLAMVWVFLVAPPCDGKYQFKLGGAEYFFFTCEPSTKTDGQSDSCKALIINIEAENFNAGQSQNICNNCHTQPGENYGPNVITDIAPNGGHKVVYDFSVDCTDTYQFEVMYAANVSRPLEVLIDGNSVFNACCSETTGGWHLPSQMWKVQGNIKLIKGNRRLTLRTNGNMPHIRRLRFTPIK
ncbi:MAG TPA: hypothetical protein PKY06_22145 [Saprospiraceae bacterium]|nr:hypothetical protein [Saprospiraceae bacterium]